MERAQISPDLRVGTGGPVAGPGGGGPPARPRRRCLRPDGVGGADAGPVPAALVALTLNVYACPGVRPLMVVNGCLLAGGVVSPWQLGQAGEGMTW